MERDNASGKFPLGSSLPSFSLPNVDGTTIDDSYLRAGKAALVVFSCNHCPYVKGSDQLLIETSIKFASAGLKVVAINSNDAAKYPEDSFERMKEKAERLSLPFPYLYDESQEVARLFDAACTPECYLFDSSQKLVFHGAICESPKDSGASRANFISKAIGQLTAGETIKPAFIHPIGCSIKWK